MKLSEMKQVLAAGRIQLTKSLGQNFLHDANQLRRIAAAAALTKADKVLEVGPGLGPLTELLIEQAGEVLAIEKDARLLQVLRERFKATEPAYLPLPKAGGEKKPAAEPALRLVLPNELEFGLGSGLRQIVIDTGFGSNGRGREAVIAGDHDGLDAHAAQFRETLLDATLHDVLQVDNAENLLPFRHHQGCPAAP